MEVILIRPGSTDFDEQGRIKGTLDIPLSEMGALQVSRAVGELHETHIDYLYASPCRSAEQTAQAIASDHQIKVRMAGELQNLDHGLWHGKLVDELKLSQPKVFRQLQEFPETVCPPQGEPVGACFDRVRVWLTRLVRKHKTGTVALVVPEPLASVVRSTLVHGEVGDLWKAECESGGWERISVQPEKLALTG
jgi:broad specificity phosphatase PhoE